MLLLFAKTISLLAASLLVVVAHPDDESVMAGSLYTLSHQGDTIDVVMITNGEGGYKYSTFAEEIYDLKLTDEAIGRCHLPAIRKKETLAGGKILGVHQYTFLGEQDYRYTLDPNEPLQEIWDTDKIDCCLEKLLKYGHYDYVFTMLPHEMTHGHHQAATILALRALNALPTDRRPIILALSPLDVPFDELPGFPLTKMADPEPIGSFDKTQPVGHNGRLNTHIPVNWFIAEHKSQGTMQMAMGKWDKEYFYFFALNNPDDLPKAKALIDSLKPKAKREDEAGASVVSPSDGGLRE